MSAGHPDERRLDGAMLEAIERVTSWCELHAAATVAAGDRRRNADLLAYGILQARCGLLIEAIEAGDLERARTLAAMFDVVPAICAAA